MLTDTGGLGRGSERWVSDSWVAPSSSEGCLSGGEGQVARGWGETRPGAPAAEADPLICLHLFSVHSPGRDNAWTARGDRWDCLLG